MLSTFIFYITWGISMDKKLNTLIKVLLVILLIVTIVTLIVLLPEIQDIFNPPDDGKSPPLSRFRKD